MKKVKLQMQLTLDAYAAGPNGELDWLVWDWDDALKSYASKLTDAVDTILMGRNMTDGFVTHWSQVAANPEDPEHAFGKKMIDTPKVVFSRTLDQSKWVNTELATGTLAETVAALKNQEGGDIIVYGGASFVASLLKERLIDDLYLFINPVVLGEGLPIFSEVASRQALDLEDATSFDCGIVVLHYALK